jgi:hypothetical protein
LLLGKLPIDSERFLEGNVVGDDDVEEDDDEEGDGVLALVSLINLSSYTIAFHRFI